MNFGKKGSKGLQAKGSTTKWRKIRHYVLKRDGHKCKMCGRRATHCDHKKLRKNGGTDELKNLRALCQTCNLARKRK
jgi:5-methylcytosine-specific restriction protein A